MTTLDYTFERDDGEEITVKLPAHWQICHRCSGEGHTSRHLGSFTQDEWAQQDDEFKEDYIAGRYDIPCETCKGSGKVLEVNRDACIHEDQKEALQRMDDEAQWKAEARAERRAEARMMGDYSDID